MSSLRVRAQNKLLTSLGTTKPSKNVQFDFAYAGYEKTQANVVELEAALRSYICCLKSYHVSAQALVRVIESVGNSVENRVETQQFATAIKTAFVQLDGHVLNDSAKRFEQRVLTPASGWLTRGHALKQQVTAFHDEKLLYDHYTRKVIALRDARDKRASAGKAEKPKHVDKLVRNEHKYAAITTSYAKLSEETIARLREFVTGREDTLTPILHRMLEFRVQYASDVHAASQKLVPLVQCDAKSDAILAQLEAFVGRLTGGKATTSTAPAPVTADQQVPVEPDVPVQSFSFATFVGEAPPVVPPTSSYETPADTSIRASSFAIEPSAALHFQPPPPPPLASPTSPDAFFAYDTTVAPTTPSAPMTFDFQSQPSAPERSSSASAWDAFPAKPLTTATATAFATLPASNLSRPAPSPAALASTWGAFDDLTPPPPPQVAATSTNPFAFQTDFADLHQQALGSSSSSSSDGHRGVSGSVSF